MTNDDTARILARVRKMLALANNAGASEGERDNAMRMAHATLAKYNLELADAEAAGTKPDEQRLIVQRTFYGRPWAKTCARAIADMCFSIYLITPAKQATQCTHWFIGRESNATTAAELAEFVVKSIWTEGHKRARALGGGNEYARNFATGASWTIASRCAELVKAATQPDQSLKSEPGTALVLASVYQQELTANEVVLKTIQTRTLKAKPKPVTRSDALSGGMEYGKSVSLNRSITGTKPKALT